MAKVKLTDAIRDGTICIGDFVNPAACFRKDNGEVICEAERTGLNEDQIFERDKENLEWIVAKDYLGNLVIYSTTTTFALQIKGKVGKENLDDLLSEICSAFSNDELGICSDLLSEDDVECWREDEFFKKKTNSWLAEDGGFVIFGSCSTHLKGQLIEHKDIISIYKLSDSDGEQAGHGITIVIPLDEEIISQILVDTESKEKDGTWKLVVSQN